MNITSYLYISLYIYRERDRETERDVYVYYTGRLPWWLRDKEFTCHAGDMSLIPGSGLEKEMATHSNILA